MHDEAGKFLESYMNLHTVNELVVYTLCALGKYWNTVKPLVKDILGPAHFVLNREVSSFQR